MLHALSLEYVIFVLAMIVLTCLRLRTVFEWTAVCGIVIAKVDLLLKFQSVAFSRVVVQVIYALLLVNAIASRFVKISSSYLILNSFSLFCCLIHKIENAILVPLVILQARLIHVTANCRPWWATGVMLNSLFLASFFYQGNSNSITTIDIAMGYTGLSNYNEYIVGLMTYLGTFSSPILVMLTLASAQSKTLWPVTPRLDGMTLKNFMRIHFIRLAFANFVFCIVVVVMRQHLFVWSVFVPKIMYQAAFTLLSVLMCAVLISFIWLAQVGTKSCKIKT